MEREGSMKRITIGLLTLICLGAFAVPLGALEVPVLKGHVNDYANMFQKPTIASLEYDLAELEKNESTQVVVLTIPSLQGEVLEEFSIKVAEKWKIGQAKLDNGVIVLVVKQDRKIRIEVGRGLEGKLTDLYAGRIIDECFKPSFKADKYDQGILQGVNCVRLAVQGEFPGMEKDPAIKKSIWKRDWFLPVAIFGGTVLFVVLLLFFINMLGSARGGSSGGSSGDGGSSSNDSGGSSSSSSSSSSDSSSGGDCSGGGGDFGGGGASSDY
jgi:uncharacterized protein